MDTIIHAYYSNQSPLSDPGPFAYLYDELPSDPAALARVVQGLLIHKMAIDFYNITISPVQRSEQMLRTIQQRLGHLVEIDSASLLSARLPEQRQVAVCRDFALLHVSMLRHKGIPARMRVGYAKYLDASGPMHYDHWISEYWDPFQQRWILFDPQIDEIQRAAYQVTADVSDLRRDVDFHVAGSAWKAAREGRIKSTFFRFNGHWKGFPCIRGNLLHDFQSLNKIELSVYDHWDELATKSETSLTPDEKLLLDRIAELTCRGDEAYDEIRSLFEQLPRTERLYSRLRLLGVLPPELVSVENRRLGGSEVIVQHGRNGKRNGYSAHSQTEQTYVPYDVPLDTPLAAMMSGQSQSGMGPGDILIRGARQHNLKHIDVRIPRNRFVVITGVSGSGKSSLAFDTIYAEGQRRYVESLSSYARQFMEQMEKPQVDQITGLSPAIAIEQKTVSRNPRSTVGTVTEVLDYLRVLYARAGIPHCPQCGRAVLPQSAQQITDQLAQMTENTRFELLAPVARNRKGTFHSVLTDALKNGYSRARVDGEVFDLSQAIPALDKNKRHQIQLLIDRLVIPAREGEHDFRSRLMDSVETCLRAGEGVLIVHFPDSQEEVVLSEHNACPVCELSFAELEPRLFSFNSPMGMCDECNGLGVVLQVDPNLIITRPEVSLLDGASPFYGNLRRKGDGAWMVRNLSAIAKHYGVELDLPWCELPEQFRKVILYGSGEEKVKFEYDSGDGRWKGESIREVNGAIKNINRLFRQTRSEGSRRFYMQFMNHLPCPKCGGERLCPEARFVTLGEKRLPEICTYSIGALHEWIQQLPTRLNEEQHQISMELIAEIRQRLSFICNVGLHYLTLDRPAPTLSGGEGQRIRLASQIGNGLTGVLYILDEPSIGLHTRDHRALLDTLIHLRDLGNTVLVVEHDAATMLASDWLIDLGPGPGVLGGELVAEGTPDEVMANPDSITGKYLSGRLQVTAPNGQSRRQAHGWLTMQGARLHNLRNIEASFPLGTMICVTGVSGSGKSSLISKTLFPALARSLNHAQTEVPGPFDRLEGLEQLNKVINITQEPIGRNPRSNPGTYVGVLDEIRRVYASTPDARAMGYSAGRFSFNVKGGRCEACAGYGFKKVEMHFLPDVWVTCKECGGRRFNHQTLDIHYKGKNIADVLDMDVQQALEFFSAHPAITRILQTLQDVGLNYIKLGQSALTLSGGEAQRVKLAKELSAIATGKTIYILDEPTTGLHFADIQHLLDVLHRLVDAGNTVIIIEHNLDVIKTADWVIDMGPDGGDKGGQIIAQGSPEAILSVPESYTAYYLREIL